MNKTCFVALLAGVTLSTWPRAASADEPTEENKASQCRDALIGAGFNLGMEMPYYFHVDLPKSEPEPNPTIDVYSDIPDNEKIEIKLSPESASRCESCSQASLVQVPEIATESLSVVFVNVDSNLPVQDAMRIMDSLMRVVKPNGRLVFVREGHVLPKVTNAASYLNFKTEPSRSVGELHVQTVLKSPAQ